VKNAMRSGSVEGTPHTARLHYPDWLRVLAVLGVFNAHSTNIYDSLYWHIRGGEQNAGLMVLVVFGTQWGMSLFFYLAGASAWFALQSRTSGQFISERFKRLIIPFIVGFILLSPPQAYLLSLSQGLYGPQLWAMRNTTERILQAARQPLFIVRR
jgi:glucan biosynthesis protein C